MKSLFTALALLLCVASYAQAAKFDTSFNYSTIETDHFSIHYHQGLETAAQKTAVIAEDVHGKLVKVFLWQPAEKTQVVLIDDTDFTNGLAVTIPYNILYLKVVPPSLASTLGEYDDWLRLLFTHEYAHILSSDPARGYSKVTRSIFGKPLPWIDPLTGLFFLVTAPPNTFMPRWWHEGMATYAESRYGGQGRGTGSFYEMIFRSAVAENNLPSVDQINGDVPYWPGGSLPYMYGYRLQSYIAETYGADATGRLSTAHSGRFPYLINKPPKDLFEGSSYRDLFKDMIDSMRRQQWDKIGMLSKASFTPVTTVYRKGENLTNPRYSPDGSRIAFTMRDPHEHRAVLITDAGGEKIIARFRRQDSDGSLSWAPDGKSIYFTQARVERGFNVYQDLYVYDLERRKIKRMTTGERVGDVQVSPDGKRFAAAVSSRGSRNLALMEVGGAEGKMKPNLVTDYPLQRVSSPRWSPDGGRICYVLTDNEGTSSIRTYHPDTKTDQLLISSDHVLAYPAWSPDGSVIYYIADETGVFNVFAYDLREHKSYQVSHLLTGALHPEPSPDGRSLLLSHYGSRGFKIARIDAERSKWMQTRGPSILPQAAPAAQQVSATPLAAQAPLPSSDFQASKTLWPRFWLPRIYNDGPDDLALGAFTAAADALGYNTYALSATYSTTRDRGYFSFLYRNDYFYPTLTLSAHAEPFLYSNLFQRGFDYYELNKGLGMEATFPVNFMESAYRIRVGYELLDQEALSLLLPDGTFNGIPVFQGRRDNVFAGVSYDGALKYPYSISSEEGRRVSFLYRRFSRDLGSDQNLSEYSASYHQYLRPAKKLLPHHVLYLRASGALADGDLQFGQQAFQIGGPPSEYNQYPLRGYPVRSMTGKYVVTGTAEYRLPLAYPMQGPGTLPAFFEKVHAAVFTDAGQVWDDQRTFHGNDTKFGGGLELRADMTLGYWAKVTPAVGFARGFNRGGENQLYFTLYLGL